MQHFWLFPIFFSQMFCGLVYFLYLCSCYVTRFVISLTQGTFAC